MEMEFQMNATPVSDALFRIQTEYIEMPDLKLTARQVQRLWNLSHEVSEVALAVLIRNGFLTRAANGAYIRSGARRDGVGLPSLARAS
jgi:hypothetical protein